MDCLGSRDQQDLPYAYGPETDCKLSNDPLSSLAYQDESPARETVLVECQLGLNVQVVQTTLLTKMLGLSVKVKANVKR